MLLRLGEALVGLYEALRRCRALVSCGVLKGCGGLWQLRGKDGAAGVGYTLMGLGTPWVHPWVHLYLPGIVEGTPGTPLFLNLGEENIKYVKV